ncbi:DUF4097 family beta strand repeat protein [Bacillus luteolus]|uniref:DUF4097 family beta strand repeat protein n=1 Tax=Litchfieldia luteola TaxID=682179 RepID=A0ABR9QM13_9BACI|nr:DUF4097 family beta strand repeat-containing protein [Cytobacillus luteolus]MBE4909545.1 DUF4097 family beta strand repeat protein [Cytobacillus luteolus]MBP1940946.1 hypothetical protein [Cytobacillus luteolus]
MKNIGYGLLFMLVVLLSGASFIYYTEGAEAFSTKLYELKENHSIDGHDIKNIEITSGPTDIEVIPHSEDVVTIELSGEVSEKMRDAYELDILEKGEALQVKITRVKHPSFTVFAINKGTLLTVKVPAKMYEELEVATSSGDITTTNLSTKNLFLTATSGDIVTDNLKVTSDFLIETKSGDIVSSNSNGGNMEFNATSGDVTLSMNIDSYMLEFSGKSGEGKVETGGFQYEHSTESFILGKKGNGSGTSIKVETTSGDFYLN